MFFIALLILSTITIAGSAAFFSVYGLAHTFSGTFWSVVIMGGSLEAGKLIAASYLYRYWKKTNWLLKTYLVSSVVALMVLTSAGIFGYLSAGYQADILPLKQVKTQIQLLEDEKSRLIERKTQIDQQIAQLPNNYVTSRIKLMKEFEAEQKLTTARIVELDKEMLSLKQNQIQTEAKIGPIIYIAQVFDLPSDNATKYLIFLIIFAFDPLAVALTLAVNIALKQRQDEEQEIVESHTIIKEVPVEKIVEVEKPVEKIIEKIVEVPVEKIVYVPQPQEEKQKEKQEEQMAVEPQITQSRIKPTRVEAIIDESRHGTGKISSSIVRSNHLPQHLQHPWRKGEALSSEAIRELTLYFKELSQKEKHEPLSLEEVKHKNSIIEIFNSQGMGNYLK